MKRQANDPDLSKRQMKKLKRTENKVTDPVEKVAGFYKLSYEDQLRKKTDTVKSAVRGLTKKMISTLPKFTKDKVLLRCKNSEGLICPVEICLPCDSHNSGGYRNKCEFTIGYNDENLLVVGFRGSTFADKPNFVLDLSGDFGKNMAKFLVPMEMIECANLFRDIIRKFPEIKAFDEKTFSGVWKTMLVRWSEKLNCMIVALEISPGSELPKELIGELTSKLAGLKFLKSCTISQSANRGQKPESTENSTIILFGNQLWQEQLFDYRFEISSEAFFQVNTKQAEILYSMIKNQLQPDSNKKTLLLDLCCGVGTIGISIASDFDKIIGLEIVPEAIENAKKNAELNGLKNIEYWTGKAEETMPKALKKFQDQNQEGDWHVSAVLDPPRNGMKEGIICAIRLNPKIERLVYVSCDVTANGAQQNFLDLCRSESKRIFGTPFKLTKVLPVDMFPNTPHVETILVFDRKM